MMRDPLSPTKDTSEHPLHVGRGAPQIVVYCGAGDCPMGISLNWLGKTHLAQMLRYYDWSQTRARGWVCPDHTGKRGGK